MLTFSGETDKWKGWVDKLQTVYPRPRRLLLQLLMTLFMSLLWSRPPHPSSAPLTQTPPRG